MLGGGAGVMPCAFALHCWLLVCLLAFSLSPSPAPPPPPPLVSFGKCSVHTLVSQCFVDRCLGYHGDLLAAEKFSVLLYITRAFAL